MYFTINSTLGITMNISIFYGSEGLENILLYSNSNITNSTQNALNYNASNRATNYYWRIMANDGSFWLNETYAFKTEGYTGHLIKNNNFAIIGILLGFFALIFVLLFKKKKRD